MAPKEVVYDSPRLWVRSQIRFYIESGGKKGRRRHGPPALLSMARGRMAGRLRRTARLYARDRDRVPFVPPTGGAPTHPVWYLSRFRHPANGLKVGPKAVAGPARTANALGRPRVWRLKAEISPVIDMHQARAEEGSRDTSVVIPEPVCCFAGCNRLDAGLRGSSPGLPLYEGRRNRKEKPRCDSCC